jgi:hypothetical protein
LSRGHNELREAVEPYAVGDLTRYLRRLIIERPYIRARLENPGGSILLMPTSNPDQVSYGAAIGNDAHLDLIEADMVLEREFSQGERDTFEQWAAGFTSEQAADYNRVKSGPIIRKRRQRVLDKMEDRLGQSFLGGTGDGHAQGVSPDKRVEPEEAGDTRREASAPSE